MANDTAWSQGWAAGARLAQERHAHEQYWSDQQRDSAIAQNQNAAMNIAQALRTGVHPDTGVKFNPMELAQLAQQHTELQAQLQDLFNPRQDVNKLGKNAAAAGNVKEPPSTVRKLTDLFRITKPPAGGARESFTPSTGAATGMDGVPLMPTQGKRVLGPVMTSTSKMRDLQALSDKWRTLPGQEEAQNARAKLQAQLNAIDSDPNLSPEARVEARNKAYGVAQAHPQLKQYTLRDGSIAWLDASQPENLPDGAVAYVNQSADVRKREDYAQSGSALPYPEWLAAEAAKGRTSVPRAQSLDQQYVANQQQLASGKPLTAEQRAFNFGYEKLIKAKVIDPRVAGYTALAGSRIVQTVDPENPSATVYDTGADAVRTHAKAPSSVDYKMQMPTAQERGRADLALSSREQIADMTDILKKRTDLFGPALGHVTNFTQWVGSQDPDAQRFKAAARIVADHLAGVFGGRSETALAQIYEIVGKNTTNPAAAIAGLEQMDKAASKIQSRGTGPQQARKGTKSLKAAMALPSMRGKTPDQVRRLLQSHGYEVAE